MAYRRTEQIKLIRDRLVERAAASSPAWSVPVYPASRLTANALMIGSLLNRLPDEDASALCKSILEEQNNNGSWSRTAGDDGNISLTIEVLEALSVSRRPEARPALNRAVKWLEANRITGDIEWETLLLLGAVTDNGYHRWTRRLGILLKQNPLRGLQRRIAPRSRSLQSAYRLLSTDKLRAIGDYAELLELQRQDGSWDGLARATVFVLTALRHAGLPLEDSIMERGWRFLRAHQLWSTYGLVQNPGDCSTLLHASAIRSLLSMGAASSALAGSALSLEHTQRAGGGWALGAQLPTDLFTTSLALEALTAIQDSPVETAWTRRRAMMLLTRSQRRDGGWPLYLKSPTAYFDHSLLRAYRSRADVTAMALSALSGDETTMAETYPARMRGVKYLLHQQNPDGTWASDLIGNNLFSTAHAIEALSWAGPEKSRRAVLSGLKALRERQQENGGWSLNGKSTVAETAWVVRALQRVPGLYNQSISRARNFLMSEMDDSSLIWCANQATFPVPYEGGPVDLWDLTTLWALEAFSPAPLRAPRSQKGTRSFYNKRVK